jgi:hypothetical protein
MNMRPEPAHFQTDQVANLATRSNAANTLRQRIEAAIESLLRLLDELDGDPDLEQWAAGSGDGLELDPADDGLADVDGFAEQLGYHWGTGR